jgi:hypothetical protein
MKESGIGRENGVEAYHACMMKTVLFTVQTLKDSADTQTKSTIINVAPPEESRIKDDWFSESGEPKRYG